MVDFPPTPRSCNVISHVTPALGRASNTEETCGYETGGPYSSVPVGELRVCRFWAPHRVVTIVSQMASFLIRLLISFCL